MDTTKQTSLYPMVEFKKDTYELDEFDCASIFVLVGAEKAMVIDAGMGIGNLLEAVRRITDKPLVLVITHAHVDHIQNAWQFGSCYVNEKDVPMFVDDVPRRKSDAARIARRQGGIYAYEPERDITPWQCQPKLLPLTEGMTFDLGGGRVVTAYAAPGHSAGSFMFLDPFSRSLFVGDALNNNLGVGHTMDPAKDNYVGLAAMLKGFEKMKALRPQVDGLYNGHHDYRPLGVPLKDSVLDHAIALTHDMMEGTYTLETLPNPLFPEHPMSIVRKDDSWLSIDPRFLPAKKA